LLTGHTAPHPADDLAIAHIPRDSFLMTQLHEVAAPPTDAECIVCRDDFEDESCIATNACNHLYHFSCLDRWFDSLKKQGSNKLDCCYCTLPVFDLLKAVRSLTLERAGAHFWQTPDQYKEERRKMEEAHRVISDALQFEGSYRCLKGIRPSLGDLSPKYRNVLGILPKFNISGLY
jgi:hypothetical protein